MLDFSNIRVLVCGDICLDIMEEGISTRLSPEAPVPVILNPTKKYSLGMAGNVAVNLSNLGAETYISGYIGVKDSQDSNKIYKLLDENNIKYIKRDIHVKTNEEVGTIIKKRIFANNNQIARLDYEKFDGENFYWLEGLKKYLKFMIQTFLILLLYLIIIKVLLINNHGNL